MKKNDGGPAFPSEQGTTPDGTWNQTYDPGMSLRDYFAAAALQGMVSLNGNRFVTSGISNESECFARRAYRLADAMLKAREAE